MSSFYEVIEPAPARLLEFLDIATSIVGPENVSRDPSWGAPNGLYGADNYGDPFPLSKPHHAAAAVRPATVDHIQKIVKAANDTRTPLWTVSRGKNLGYGGSAPVVSGTVILDLHRMTNIIEINEEYAYAIVEPGVTFMQLHAEIRRRNLNLWMSVPALGWGSVIGNALERGFGYTQEAVHYKQQSGLEVVLPNGDLLRTGMGAMEHNKTWPLYSGGLGPGVDGLFFQSNYGIVTKMGIHLSHAPEAYTRIQVDCFNDEDVVPLTGALTELMRRRVVTNPPQLFNTMTIITGMIGTSNEVTEALGPHSSLKHRIPADIVADITKRLKLPAWRTAFAIYAPREAHAGLIEAIKRRFELVNGSKLTTETFTAPSGEFLRGEDVAPDFLPQNGVPSIDHLKMLEGHNGGDGLWHNSYSPVIPPSGRELYEWYLGAKKITEDNDLNFVADFHVFDRYVIAINLVLFHPLAKTRLHPLQMALMEHTRKLGYLEYRAHISFMDVTAAHQNFNGGAFGRFTTLLKDAIDPNGILSPGKQGVWNTGAGPKL
ncbi:Vanillyl-alcohol oxidase [Colletotrichum gloeosporioides]|uniref:Vanillyl-alcohol oxidase n=1 Tax=Colletotrichum gloeosporioides TaxID=474922 RepID=A0A8H4FMT0_COLGL|nr:Vanillyl-alcohol oxidase [Colletotrichum gloeosporioides]KAF3807711.1 Vanillyl-alcohol oxidase [Colletotrichum gloeosporioides]